MTYDDDESQGAMEWEMMNRDEDSSYFNWGIFQLKWCDESDTDDHTALVTWCWGCGGDPWEVRGGLALTQVPSPLEDPDHDGLCAKCRERIHWPSKKQWVLESDGWTAANVTAQDLQVLLNAGVIGWVQAKDDEDWGG